MSPKEQARLASFVSKDFTAKSGGQPGEYYVPYLLCSKKGDPRPYYHVRKWHWKDGKREALQLFDMPCSDFLENHTFINLLHN